jgi:hypothetical protein
MKALSIQQPWAWAILHAGKDVENRTWTHNYRGQILVHAGKKFDKAGYAWLIDQSLRNGPIKLTIDDIPAKEDFYRGGLVGRVVIKKMVRSIGYSPWMFGPWGWVLEDPEPIDFLPYTGRLGLFDVNITRHTKGCARQ